MPMAVDITSNASNMRKIFDLCDKNGDGLINSDDFKGIGGEYFNVEQVEKLLELMDPCNTGDISFIMFCRGVETFQLETDCVQRSESVTSTISNTSTVSDYINNRSDSTGELISDREGEETISSEDIYPAAVVATGNMSNGYSHASSIGIEIAVDTPTDCPLNNSLHSMSPRRRSPGSSPGVSKESPTLIAKHLLMTRRQQQHLSSMDSPSQGSTPGEMADEEVNKLSGELSELNSRLLELEVEQKDQEGYRTRLKKENRELKQRLEEYEDMIRTYEQNQEQMAKDSEAKLKSMTRMMRVQNERSISDLTSRLAAASEEESRHKDREASLRIQLTHMEQKLELKEEAIEEMAERQGAVQNELQRARDELRTEKAKWKEEMDSLTQVLHERDEHIQHLQSECEDMRIDHRETSITASDMDGEVNRLKKLLEEANKKNEEWEAKFLRQGQILVAADSVPQSLSLEAEIENVSKDEVMDALKKTEDTNLRLQDYLDTLLCNIMTKHPELLEIN